MLNLITWFFLIAISGCAQLPKNKARSSELNPTLSYVFQKNKSNSITVSLEFKGSSKGETEIMYAHEWAGSVFHDDITDFKVLNKDARIQSTKERNVKLIFHRPSELLKITYQVTQNVVSPDRTYRALISDQYFHFIGQAALVTPAVEDEKKDYQVTMFFKGFPKKIKLANSFFALKNKHTFKAPMYEILYGIYIGGDFRIQKILIKDKPLYIAIRGDWKFKDEELFQISEKIVSFQRDFFKDHNFDQFLISMIPNGLDCCSSGGTGLTKAFATFLSKDVDIHTQIKMLLSHELFHTWNGNRIGRQEPEQLVYWFSEGFTDYYSRVLLLRAGEISFKEFLDDYNKMLYEYYTSEVINQPNSRILKDFWTNDDVQKLPYRRGHILAHKWNAEIKSKSKNLNSIDNILIDLFKEALSQGTVISENSFIRISSPYMDGGFKSDLERYINKGQTIIPGSNDLGPCAIRKELNIGRFEHGYDSIQTYNTKVISGLKKESPAYKAGLRNGDQLLERKMVNPPFKESSITIQDKNGQEKTIQFFPVGNKKYKAYFFELNEKAFKSDPKLCLDFFK